MDTFTRSWEFENNWLCPPPRLVPRTLRHMRSCCTKGTLITPLWRSAPFWPLFTSDGLHLASFVVDWLDLPPLKTTFRFGCHNNGVFGREDLQSFWQYALISDPLAFSMQAFAPVILARVRNVALFVFGN